MKFVAKGMIKMKKHEFNAKGMACPLPVVQTKKLLAEYDVVETTVDNFVATENLTKLAEQLNYNVDVKKVSDEEYIVTVSNPAAGKEEKKAKFIDTSEDRCVLPVIQAKRALEKNSLVELLVNDEENVKKIHDFAAENNCKFVSEVTESGVYKVILEKEVTEEKEQILQIKDDSYIVVINKQIMGHGNEELGKKLIKAFLYTLTEQEVLPKKILFYNGGALLVDKNRSHVLKELKELEDNGVEIMCCGACIDYYKVDLAIGNSSNMYFIVEDMRTANRVVRP